MLSPRFLRALRAACLLGGAIVLASAFGVPHASAHAYLVSSVPAGGTTVTAAPPHLTLTYTEGVVPHFCKVSVEGPDGKPVAIGQPEGDAGHADVLLVSLPHLAPGRYKVTWHAVATDTHHTEGAFHFNVLPASMQ